MPQLTFDQLPSTVAMLVEEIQRMRKTIEELTSSISPSKESDEMLTINEAAVYLKLAVPTIYSRVSKSLIPVNKVGKRLYFSKNELATWIKEGRKKTTCEMEKEADRYLLIKSKKR